MVADDPESSADLDGHAQYGDCGPGLTECNDKGGPLTAGHCGHTTDGIGVCHVASDPLDDLVKKLQKGVDSFNEYLGFGKSDCATDCVNALGMAGTAVLAGVASEGASEEETIAAKGEVFVYRIEKAGKTIYVGVTNDLIRRAREHGVKELIPIIESLSRRDAKGVEQALLNLARKEAVPLENKINSIARNNPNYSRAVAFGEKLLEDIGFSFKSPL